MAEDTIKFVASAPPDADGVQFTGVILERWRKNAPLRRRVVHNVLGLGHTLHYLGPGGQRFSARIRIEGEDMEDLEDKIDEILALDGAFGTVTITPGTSGQYDSRKNNDPYTNMLLEEVVQGEEIIAGVEKYAQIIVLSFLKLKIVGTVS